MSIFCQYFMATASLKKLKICSWFIDFIHVMYKSYKLSYIIYGKLNLALQVLEPCITSPSLRFSLHIQY